MKNKGFTVFELMVTVVFCLIVISLVSYGIGGCGPDAEKANKLAQDFAKHIPGTTGSVTCMNRDSDGDGYCRCTIFTQTGYDLIECDCRRYCLWDCANSCAPVETVKVKQNTSRSRDL